MDIFPQHTGFFVSLDLLGAIRTTLETGPDQEIIEQSIKTIEKISQEQPREVLRKGVVVVCYGLLDFIFD